MWCFPGGAPDINEGSLDTVIREAYEEYELVLKREDCDFLTAQQVNYESNGVNDIFVCQIKSDQQPILHEGADMKWMSLDKIKQLKLGFEQDIIVEQLERFLQKI